MNGKLTAGLAAALVALLGSAVRVALVTAEEANKRADSLAQEFADYRAAQGERLATLEQQAVERLPSEIDLRLRPIEKLLGKLEERWERWLPQIILTDPKPKSGD